MANKRIGQAGLALIKQHEGTVTRLAYIVA